MQKLSVGPNKSNYTAGPSAPATEELAVPTPISQQTVTTPMAQPGVTDQQLGSSRIQKGSPSMKKKSASMISYIVIGVAIGAGVFTGLGAVRLSAKSGTNPLTGAAAQPISQVAGDNVKNGDVFGSADEKSFKDSAVGYLEIGGLDGEGTHKLLRDGGDTQTVYLTSSVTDLSKFDGMNVRIWGETFKAQKAGWLMDVGRVQVIETQGTAPSDE